MSDTRLLQAVATAQRSAARTVAWQEQWVRAASIWKHDGRPGLGSRLAALERAGLIESVHREASFSLSRRYDVCWRLTKRGREA